jgi:glycosyltransferase involved in cell wall biosynthesis
MHDQTYTIVIPTHERPELLGRALQSALGQTLPPPEVIVVDDGSDPPVRLAPDERVRLVRLEKNRGNAAARNAGLAAARCRWITFLDDDDVLLPIMAERSLAALEATALPAPVGVISGVEVIDIDGQTLDIRLPPTLARGRHFALEDIPAGASFLSKQTLFVERQVLLAIGGFDEAFRSRAPSEMFLRLNPVCSLLGLREVTYRQFRHPGVRVSTDRKLRRASFAQLVAKHEAVFRAHPRGFARMLVEHARTLSRDGDRAGALRALVRAARLAPATAVHLLAASRKRRKA